MTLGDSDVGSAGDVGATDVGATSVDVGATDVGAFSADVVVVDFNASVTSVDDFTDDTGFADVGFSDVNVDTGFVLLLRVIFIPLFSPYCPVAVFIVIGDIVFSTIRRLVSETAETVFCTFVCSLPLKPRALRTLFSDIVLPTAAGVLTTAAGVLTTAGGVLTTGGVRFTDCCCGSPRLIPAGGVRLTGDEEADEVGVVLTAAPVLFADAPVGGVLLPSFLEFVDESGFLQSFLFSSRPFSAFSFLALA